MSDLRGSAIVPVAVLENDEAQRHGTNSITLGDFMTTYDCMRFVRGPVLRQNNSVGAGASNGHHPPQPNQGLAVLGLADEWLAPVHDGPIDSPSAPAPYVAHARAQRLP